MMRRLMRLTALSVILVVAAAATARAQQALPDGVTKQMVDDGAKLFSGQGLCHACHGPQGKGMPGMGANLTDKQWLHSDGSYDGIVKTVMSGVPSDKSSNHSVMPPKGGSSLNDAQIKAVAAYVWSLSNAK
ncbi:MAG: c-type cytochrome [Gemmatimonadales bacterium]|jgi:cbb3-type cytochrome c oxidase subunit III|nr:c-type cytochrome [Gemmatimonadales bacterium]